MKTQKIKSLNNKDSKVEQTRAKLMLQIRDSHKTLHENHLGIFSNYNTYGKDQK